MTDKEAIKSIIRTNLSLCVYYLENSYKYAELPISACTCCEHREEDDECLFSKCADEILKVVSMPDAVVNGGSK